MSYPRHISQIEKQKDQGINTQSGSRMLDPLVQLCMAFKTLKRADNSADSRADNKPYTFGPFD